ncbi:MAG: hypothetical protein O3A47_12010 [Chloroflexi bacterium]|nr:hypothetical protein [Chloroflexota bacterium]
MEQKRTPKQDIDDQGRLSPIATSVPDRVLVADAVLARSRLMA